jgi:redox-sensitive bicupin YhaK (pirin superfamily)
MIDVRRVGDRYESHHGGVRSWHCFSSGSHFDPDNVAFGPVIACDEHAVGPGAGFDQHAHARVELVSWVIDGTMEHLDATGGRRLIGAGSVQYQAAGRGIRHSERNASSLERLRFVQIWIMSERAAPEYSLGPPPVTLSVGGFDVLRRCRGTRLSARLVHLFVGRGNFHVAGHDLVPGDSVRVTDGVEVDGDGELLVVTVDG